MREKQFSLHFDPVGDVLTAARRCEADVFLETYGNTTEQWQEEYGPYEQASVFLAITNRSGEAVGCARLILPNPAGLKSLVDTEGEPWLIDATRSAISAGMSVKQTCDIATLAVRRGAAGAGVLSAALYHGIVSVIRANSLRWVVMIMDARARRLLSVLNLETHALPGTRAAAYLGSPASIPIFADVIHMMDAQSRLNPEGHRLINDGIGLNTIAIPEPNAFIIGSQPEAMVTRFVPRRHEEVGPYSDAARRTA